MTAFGPSASIPILNGDVAVVTSDGMSFSWEELYEEYAPPLLSYARSRGVRSAEDLVQDVLVAAVERLETFQGDQQNLRSWLFAITYRRVADEHRRSYRHREMLVADQTTIASRDDMVEDIVTRKDSAGRAMQAFEILTDRERQVLEMRIIEEATPAEVASALGLSNGNVRVIQARALVKIRKHLESGTAVSAGLVFAFLKYMKSELPAEGLLWSWIGDLRSQAISGAVEAAPASSVGIADVSETAAGAVAASSGAAATAIKLGLIVSLATASTVATGAAVASPGTTPASSQTQSSGTINTDDPRPPHEELGVRPAADQTGLDVPTENIEPKPAELTPVDRETSTPEEAPSTSEEPPAGGSRDDDAKPESASESAPGSIVENTDEVVEDTDETVVEVVVETIETVLEDTVETVVELVVETTETVIEDILEPVVTKTTEAVDNIVEPVVEQVVEPVLEDVTEATNGTVETVGDITGSVVSGLGGLLGG